MSFAIRLAAPTDADQIAAIYSPEVLGTAISFEVEPPSPEEMRKRVEHTLESLPWLVCEGEDRVLGYAYASPHRSRAAYQWSVDTAIYIHPAQRRRGIGRGLYTALLGILPLQGYFNACAGITLPNPASVRLHEAEGFEPVGVYRHIGYKLGAWHDVGWWQCSLRTPGATPAEPLPLSAVQTERAWQLKLAEGLKHIH